IRLDGTTVKEFDVEATEKDRRTYEVPVVVEAGTHRFAVAFLNDYYREDAEDPEDRGDRNLVIQRLDVQGPTDPIVRREVESLDPKAGGENYRNVGRILASHGEVTFDFPFEGDGEYRIRALAFGHQA